MVLRSDRPVKTPCGPENPCQVCGASRVCYTVADGHWCAARHHGDRVPTGFIRQREAALGGITFTQWLRVPSPEGPRFEPGRNGRHAHVLNDIAVNADAQSAKKPSCWEFEPILSTTFFATDYRPNWLIKGVLVALQPAIVGGPLKTMKTSLLIDLVVSLATGKPFLDEFAVPKAVPVVILSGESGEHTIQNTARRVCAAKGVNPSHMPVMWQFNLPQLANPLDMAALSEGLAKVGAEVVAVDPLYLCLLGGQDGREIDPANLYQMGPLFQAVTRACLDAGATPILAHHTRKHIKPGEPIELTDLSHAGISEFARQWLLVNRHKAYEPGSGLHSLWLSVGGSAGQTGLWEVNIDEGTIGDDFGGRRWDVAVRPGDKVRAEKKAGADVRKNEKDEKDAHRFMKELDELAKASPSGVGTRALRDLLGWNNDRINHIVAMLKKHGEIEELKIEVPFGKKATREALAVRRVTED